MLDETNPSDITVSAASGAAPDGAAAVAPVKKTAARKTAAKKAAKKAPAKKTASPEVPEAALEALAVATDAPAGDEAAPAKKAPARRTRKAPAKKVVESPAAADDSAAVPAKKAAAKKAPAKKAAAKKAPAKRVAVKKASAPSADTEVAAIEGDALSDSDSTAETLPLFQAPEAVKKAPARRTRKRTAAPVVEVPVEKTDEELAEEAAAAAAAGETTETVETTEVAEIAAPAESALPEDGAESEGDDDSDGDDDSEDGTPTRRRRRRGGRRRRKPSDGGEQDNNDDDADQTGDPAPRAKADAEQEKTEDTEGGEDSSDNGDGESGSSSSRRRRRRRRSGDNDSEPADDPENTVVRVRKTRSAEDQITAVAGSTRLEAKKQRRREGREAGRRRAPIVSEAEFLARREAVERVMVVRQRADLTQIAVLEDKVLVEHYVARESQTSIIGNVYLGRVQNVLPSMEAAFVDIGKGRNAVLYAGEVNWSSLGHKDGQQRKIESVLSPGQPVLVQVTKDPIGHKGARLTSQVSLAGRFLVYVPDGTTSGISRKLPDTERSRLKSLLKEIVPDSAGVIVRTAAEGASEDELTSDVERLKARWEDIESKSRGNGPQLLYGEPDLTLKVVRDLFTEDFTKLVIEGDDAWQTVSDYVEHVAPDLAERLERYAPADAASAHQGDIFSVYRIDEQIAKGLDRKVWLPSGGSLVIDRTEAMTVVDVNTGKFTGSGGNLEETVTKNNLEAAEEIVRQLRLRDIGGIIVVDFIDMVLESNRDLVVRRMVECLGRDRTRHQVAEVTSLGLVQMTRKRIGTGLLEAFSSDCEHCQGRGVVTHAQPVEQKSGGDDDGRRGGRRGRGRGRDDDNSSGNSSGNQSGKGGGRDGGRGRGGEKKSDDQHSSDQNSKAQNAGAQHSAPSPNDIAAKARHEAHEESTGAASVSAESTSTDTGDATSSAPAAEAPVVQVTTTRRSSRSRGRRSAGEQGSEANREMAEPGAGAAATSAPVSPQQIAPPASEPAAEPAAGGAPKVVTRTRRGGASRSTTTSGAAVAVTVVPTAVVEAPAAEKTVEVSEASKPKVITRTRGRAASGAVGQPTGEEVQAGGDNADESSHEHVPVKNKGARKR